MKTQAPRILISAGEASGDLHGANLIAAMKRLSPELTVSGMGGERMQAAGLDVLVDASSMAVVGLVEVIGHLWHIRKALNILTRALRNSSPDLLILIDYPEFNLLLAAQAKKLNIPVYYYISPQVWAWRSGRVKKIQRLTDRMAVILPFEKEFYAKAGMEVDFVGHPLLDAVRTTIPREAFLREHGINPEATVVGILPGSRKKELSSLLPVFLETARKLAALVNNVVFLLPLATTLSRKDLDVYGLNNCSLDIKVISEHPYDMMAACDVAIAASGTVTLELAILNVPMVMAYRVSPLTYFLGKRLINVKYASLVNLVAEEEVIPELLQDRATPDRLSKAAADLLTDSFRRERMREQLKQVAARLGAPGASECAARLALALIHKKPGS